MEDDDDVAVLSFPNPKVEEEEGKKEGNILIFLDSLDGYMTLLVSLTSTLRKGWLDLAKARHSMGSPRISSSLFDLKVQSAATTLQVFESAKESRPDLHYRLSKWASLRDSMDDVEELQKSNTPQLRHRGASHTLEGPQEPSRASALDTSPTAADNNIQMGRSRSLAVFGTLVSPKLRSAQVTFETALDTIVEIANMRAAFLSAFSQLQKEKICQTEVQADLGS